MRAIIIAVIEITSTIMTAPPTITVMWLGLLPQFCRVVLLPILFELVNLQTLADLQN